MMVIARRIRDFLADDQFLRGNYASTMWKSLLGQCYPEFSHMELEDILLTICARAVSNEESTDSSLLRYCEFASGVGNLSKALLRRGLHGGSFDIIYDESHDCLKPEGFKLWLLALSSMSQDGLAWFGTKCSSWVVLCMSQSDRRVENNWWGDQDREFVIEGNALMTVTSLLFFLGFLLGHTVILEQPRSSSMPLVPLMASVLAFAKCLRCDTYLGSYGSRTEKAIQLWSNKSFETLRRDKPTLEANSLCSHDDSGGFTGKKDELKESEVYPILFGEAVADFFVGSTAVS